MSSALKNSKLQSFANKYGVLALSLLLGFVLRWYSISKASFPLNDGGLFYTMTRDLIANHFVLPVVSSFNQLAIPFAYPPLGFYLVGAINQLTGCDLLSIFRFLPLIFSLLVVVAFFFLAREYFSNDSLANVATLIFAITPNAYRWLIMGGSITRAPAIFCQLICLFFYLRWLHHGKISQLIVSAIFAAFTLLFHLEIFLVTCIGLFVFFIFNPPNKRQWIAAAGMAFAVAVFTSPYWIINLSRHGIAVFRNAFVSNGFNILDSIFKMLLFNFTDEFTTPIIAVLALLGLFFCIKQRKFLLPVWLLLIVLFNQRSIDRSSMIPVAMLAAICIGDVLIPIFGEAQTSIADHPNPKKQSRNVILILFFLQIFLISYLRGVSDNQVLVGLDSPAQSAMNWIRKVMPNDARFLIVDDSYDWETDEFAEWFPAITERVSIATIQGLEWSQPDIYYGFDQINNDLKKCNSHDTECLLQWKDQYKMNFDYLIVKETPCDQQNIFCLAPLAASIRNDERFQYIYRQDGIEIFRLAQ